MSMLVSMLSRLSSSVELCRAVDTLGYVELSIDTLTVLTYLDTTEASSRGGSMSRLCRGCRALCRAMSRYVEAVALTYTLTLMSRYVEVCRVCRQYVDSMSRYVETGLSMWHPSRRNTLEAGSGAESGTLVSSLACRAAFFLTFASDMAQKSSFLVHICTPVSHSVNTAPTSRAL